MKAIMYHYVQEFEKSLPNFRFLDIDNFRKQLDFFEKNFGFVSREEWNKIISKKKLVIIKTRLFLLLMMRLNVILNMFILN